MWTSLPSTHNVTCTPYCKFSILWSIKWVSYTLTLLAKMLGFCYSTDKIIHTMFIVTVSVMFFNQSQFSALSCTHCPPAKCIRRQREHQRMPNDVYTTSHNHYNCRRISRVTNSRRKHLQFTPFGRRSCDDDVSYFRCAVCMTRNSHGHLSRVSI